MEPYFSIVIPMFNRARFIGRALDSCLRQDCEDFEIIVVDDGSTDGSPEVVRAYTDSRIALLCHERNRGVCPARNTGIARARGKWVICFDSDDEFAEGALRRMRERTVDLSPEMGGSHFMCRLDSGRTSPDPPLPERVFDYEGYVRWMERMQNHLSETLPCVRRGTFPKVQYPDDRSLELLYHLDFTRAFTFRGFPDVVRLYHQDAENRYCGRASADALLLRAVDEARGAERIIADHGPALRQWAPAVWIEVIRSASTAHFLAGNRPKGFQYALRYLRFRPRSFKGWVVVLLGMLGPKALAWLKTKTHRAVYEARKRM